MATSGENPELSPLVDGGTSVTYSQKVVRPRWQKWALAALIAAIAVEAVVFVSRRGNDADVTATAGTTITSTSAAPVATSATTTSGLPSTTSDPDAACRASFAAAVATGTEAARFATITVCSEDQWARMQIATPIPGVTLAVLCGARYGLAATACATADAERVARERSAAQTTAAPPATADRPAATAPPDTTPADVPSQVVYKSAGNSPNSSGRIGTGSFTVSGNWSFIPGNSIGDMSSCTSTLTIYKPGYKPSGIAPVSAVGNIVPTGDFSASGTFTAEINYTCSRQNPNEIGSTFAWTLGVVD